MNSQPDENVNTKSPRLLGFHKQVLGLIENMRAGHAAALTCLLTYDTAAPGRTHAPATSPAACTGGREASRTVQLRLLGRHGG